MQPFIDFFNIVFDFSFVAELFNVYPLSRTH